MYQTDVIHVEASHARGIGVVDKVEFGQGRCGRKTRSSETDIEGNAVGARVDIGIVGYELLADGGRIGQDGELMVGGTG